MEFIDQWLRRGPPQPFWLAGCFSARSVCTAMLQQFARHNGHKIDAVGFSFTVLTESGYETCEELAPALAFDVSGLFLHGASWSPEDTVRLPIAYALVCL